MTNQASQASPKNSKRPGDVTVDQAMDNFRNAMRLSAGILLTASNPSLPEDLVQETITRSLMFLTTNCIVSIYTHAIRGGEYLPPNPCQEDLLKMAKRVAATLHSAIDSLEKEEKELLASGEAIDFYLTALRAIKQ